MQVILLAAGVSSRLDPIADKNTLEFSGKTLVEHQIAALKAAKLRDIVVVAGAHNIEALKKAVKEFSNVVVTEQKNLDEGMAGGVLAGAAKVSHKNVLVFSTNDVVEPWLFEKMIEASKKDVQGVIAGAKVETYFPGGYIKMDKLKNYVQEIVEKPKEGKEPSNWVNMVVHIYNEFPKFVDTLKKTKGKADGRYEEALSTYIAKGKAKMQLFKYLGNWHPIKYPWNVLTVMQYFLSKQTPRIDRSATIDKSAKISGNVVIGPKARVLNNAVIIGPAYIGANAVIGNNSLVRESMIGNNCVVGFTSEVARSYLNHDVWLHTNYVGDSIVDSNVSFGSGTVIGNLRFDEQPILMNIKGEKISVGSNKFGAVIGSGVRFGINSSTNPGVKVGANTFVGGAVMVDKDLPANKLVTAKQTQVVVENKAGADTTKRGK